MSSCAFDHCREEEDMKNRNLQTVLLAERSGRTKCWTCSHILRRASKSMNFTKTLHFTKIETSFRESTRQRQDESPNYKDSSLFNKFLPAPLLNSLRPTTPALPAPSFFFFMKGGVACRGVSILAGFASIPRTSLARDDNGIIYIAEQVFSRH